MPLIRTEKELRKQLLALTEPTSLGLVPTMGALHQGHAALVEKAVEENNTVVVSIFVNPTQFNNQEDLKKYPQDLTSDVSMLEGISPKIIVFAPSVEEMYQTNVSAKSYDFDGLENVMEGAFREGHFNGVGTIVEALLRLVSPNRAYFGEKDFQQLQIIKKLVASLSLPIEIVGCPIVREPNGLAMSSRNERLTKVLRNEASFIYNTLVKAKNKFGTKSANYVQEWVSTQFKKNPHFELEYIKITDVDTLSPVKKKQRNKKYRAFIAVYADNVRLIDNIALN